MLDDRLSLLKIFNARIKELSVEREKELERLRNSYHFNKRIKTEIITKINKIDQAIKVNKDLANGVLR